MAYHTYHNHYDHFASLQPMLIPPSMPDSDLNQYHSIDPRTDGVPSTGVEILASTPVSYPLLSRSNPIDISMPLYHPLPLDPNHIEPTPFTTTYSSPPYAHSPSAYICTMAPTPDFYNYHPEWDMMSLQLYTSPSATPATSSIDLLTRDSSPAEMFKVDFDFPSPQGQPVTTYEFVPTADYTPMSHALPSTTGIDFTISDFVPSPEPQPILSTVTSPQPLPTFLLNDLMSSAQESPKPAFEFYNPDLMAAQTQPQRTYEFINEDPSSKFFKTAPPAPPSTAAPFPLRRSFTSRSSTSSSSSARSSPPTHNPLPNITSIMTSSITDPTTVALTLVDALPSVLAFSPATAPAQHSTVAPTDIFRCHECKQSFPTLQLLRQHVKSHSPTFPSLERSTDSLTAAAAAAAAALPVGQRKFECAECGKSFTRKQDFVRHQHTHVEGFRPYECGNCGMRFSRSDALSRHYRRKICRE